MEDSLDPLFRGHQTGFLGGQVDAGFVADTEFVAVVRKTIDAHLHADGIKKDVTRLENSVVQTGWPMRVWSALRVIDIAVILAAEKSAITGAICRETLRYLVIFQHRGGRHDLENRAWRELRLNGAIEKRL